MYNVHIRIYMFVLHLYIHYAYVCVFVFQVRVKESERRRRIEKEEERVRSEKKADQWIQQKRQERLKEQTVRTTRTMSYCAQILHKENIHVNIHMYIHVYSYCTHLGRSVVYNLMLEACWVK